MMIDASYFERSKEINILELSSLGLHIVRLYSVTFVKRKLA